MAKLFIKGSHPTPFIHEVKEDEVTVVGRSEDCELHIDSPEISRRHCSIYLENDQLFVEDAASKLGTRVNGVKVEKSKLKVGDVIKLSPYSTLKISNKAASKKKSSKSAIADETSSTAVTARLSQVAPEVEEPQQAGGISKKKMGIYIGIFVVLLLLIIVGLVTQKQKGETTSLTQEKYLSIIDDVLKKYKEDEIFDEKKLKTAKLNDARFNTSEELKKAIEILESNPPSKKDFNWNDAENQFQKLKDSILLSDYQKEWIDEKMLIIENEKEHQQSFNKIQANIDQNRLEKAFLLFKKLPEESLYKQFHKEKVSEQLKQHIKEQERIALNHINKEELIEAAKIYGLIAKVTEGEQYEKYIKLTEKYSGVGHDAKLYEEITLLIHLEKHKEATELFSQMSTNSPHQRSIARELRNLAVKLNSDDARELYKQGKVNQAIIKLNDQSDSDVELGKHMKRVAVLFDTAARAFQNKNLKLALEKWKEVILLERDPRNYYHHISNVSLNKWPSDRARAQQHIDWGDVAIKDERYNEARLLYLGANHFKTKSADLHLENMAFLAEKLYNQAVAAKAPDKSLPLFEKALRLLTPEDKLYVSVVSEINGIKKQEE
jgi:pSer/pThr/pTyr-binding forkhead associated (FHA) protein